MRLLATPLLALLLATAAPAQDAGERLWTVDVASLNVGSNVWMSQPRVAPDGTIYLVTDSLYAISPAGEILWTAAGRASYVDLGPDGTVYTSAGRTVYAYHPDGTERWRFTDSGGWGVTTGPTVGPDGNVYAVNIQGGLGAFSLTPEGELRWSVPGFLTQDGAELGRVAFGPNNLYYADEGLWNVEGCEAPYTGLVSISLDGEVEWCRSISGTEDPPNGVQATLDGRAVLIRSAVPGAGIHVYTPDGSLDWAQPVGSTVSVGPDNNLYAWRSRRLFSLTDDGDERWAEIPPINNFPVRPAVAPDLSAVVAGSVYAFGENGTIIAADPADGSTLWSLPVTGPSAGAGAPAAFSPDGGVAYVPINTLSQDEPDQLWAIRVYGMVVTAPEPGAPGALMALSGPSPNPAAASARLTLTLERGQAVSVTLHDALGRRVAVLHEGTLAAGTHPLHVAAGALSPGVYVVRADGPAGALARRLVVTR